MAEKKQLILLADKLFYFALTGSTHSCDQS